MPLIVEVAILSSINQTFDYLSPYEVMRGVRVVVPFGNRKLIGVVLANKQKSSILKLKTVEKILDDKPILDKEMLDFLTWAANYYHHSIGDVISCALPRNLCLGKEAIIKKTIKPTNDVKSCSFSIIKEQKIAIDAILKTRDSYQGYLLYGITGSGKTEVYLQVAKEIIASGKQVLILVPEIGLTLQMIISFATRLGTPVVAIHSQLSNQQKLDAYLMAKNNKAGVILGTRSAIFTPMFNLGLIVVDEEHDSSFKQQSGFRYSARDLSIIRAKKANALLVLGSATPSLESLKNVVTKKLSMLKLIKRVSGAILPKISLIDLNKHYTDILSAPLVEKIDKYLTLGKQVMLFINRRGYASVYFCTECAWQAMCVRCERKMVYHLGVHRLKCHYCNTQQMPVNTCPQCGKYSLKVLGFGTEKLAETLASYFVDTPIIRVDRDTTSRKQAFLKHLEQINSQKPCIIVGTQMLAKGHHFAQLAMVGVLDIDCGLLLTEFRATEYLAQLLIQVSGRAGRGREQGEVVIQSYYPQHPIFSYIKNSQYMEFAKELLAQRRVAVMPPFAYQALLCANAKNRKNAESFLLEVANLLKNINIKTVEVLGPVSAIIEKKADYYYYNLYIQSTKRAALHKMLATFTKHTYLLKFKNKVRWYLDIDPI